MSSAVHFGAGNIGRGFLGQLLFEGGYQTTFIDANSELVEALNARGNYPLRLVSDTATEDLIISDVLAIDVRRDPQAVTDALIGAEIASTAVGVKILPHIAPILAAGINARAGANSAPLDILLCENQWHAAAHLRELLMPHIAPRAWNYFETKVGLVETVIGRMVPAPTEAQRAEDPLLIVAEPYKELPIARAMLRGPVPHLAGLIPADDFDAYEARKLFLHNAGHAALAYLGYPKGYEFIWQCVGDDEIHAICRAALAESAQALVAEYEFTPASLLAFNDDLLRRFANRALGDPVARVAADPLRKLRPSDRLVGAANLCYSNDIVPKALCSIIAAALRYDNPDDSAAVELQARRTAEGDATVLRFVCGIEPHSALSRLVQPASKSH